MALQRWLGLIASALLVEIVLGWNSRLLLYLGLLLFTLPLAVVLCLPAHHLPGFSSLKPSHIPLSLLHLKMVKTIMQA